MVSGLPRTVRSLGNSGSDLPPSDRSTTLGRIEEGRASIPRKRHTPEQIIRKLREAEVELAKGQTTVDVVRKLGITEQTYYRWRKEYGGLRMDQAKRLKELEKENSRLKKLLAEQALDNAILKEVSSGNF
jgi:putative transposase